MTNTPHKDCPVHGENLYWDISKPFECTCSPTPRTWERKISDLIQKRCISGEEFDSLIAEISTIEDEAVRRRDNELKKNIRELKKPSIIPKGVSEEYADMSNRYQLWKEEILDELLALLNDN